MKTRAVVVVARKRVNSSSLMTTEKRSQSYDGHLAFEPDDHSSQDY